MTRAPEWVRAHDESLADLRGSGRVPTVGYAEPFTEPDARVASLARFVDFYNRRRPHWSLAGQPPISGVPVNNLTGKNS